MAENEARIENILPMTHNYSGLLEGLMLTQL